MPVMKTIYYSQIDSPVGKLLLAATDSGLRCLHFDDGTMPKMRRNEVWICAPEKLSVYQQQINAYFRGELQKFTFPLDLVGTAFQKKCWNALLRIPYGKTCSYADIAQKVGSPRAFRAVGQANHNNPIAIVVPCHRVVTASGILGGYGGGLSTKEKLLRLEGVSSFNSTAGKSSSAKSAAAQSGNLFSNRTAS